MEVNLRVSRQNLAANIRPLVADLSAASPRINLSLGSLKNIKDRPFKEIKDKLDIKPIKLKPNWSGQRLAGSYSGKEVWAT